MSIKKYIYLPIKWMIKEQVEKSKLKTKTVTEALNEYKDLKVKLLEAERKQRKEDIIKYKAKIEVINWFLIKK